MKPILKEPTAKRLKPKSDKMPSNFAFKFNLRRYNLEPVALPRWTRLSSEEWTKVGWRWYPKP
jgi:hypothetical protein